MTNKETLARALCMEYFMARSNKKTHKQREGDAKEVVDRMWVTWGPLAETLCAKLGVNPDVESKHIA